MSELRPSFQERDRYLDLLSAAYADGRLDEAEFEVRSNAVLAAVTHRDAMAQFAGLPQPNIVPVQAPPAAFRPQPAPPAAFQPLPAVYDGSPPGGVGRRTLLGVGAAAVGLVALGVISFSGPTMMDSDSGFLGVPEPEWVGVVVDAEPIFFEGWAETSAILREQSLDSVSALTITVDEIRGVAMQARSPGEASQFSRLGFDAVEVTASSQSAPAELVELDLMDTLVQTGLDQAGANLTGAIKEVRLEWSVAGEPRARVTATDSTSDGWVLVDPAGNVVEMQPVGQR
ncbi:DUF1707 SHOCT-like domain-containing protein [Tessaracoccus sp. G1721]